MSNDTALQSGDLIRVLVADDDPLQRSLIAARLIALNGLAIEAEDGRVAWDLLAAQSFDLAIVDLGMPNINGFDLIRCMRGHPRTRHLPIIVVTSRDDRDAIEQAFAAGASSFLTKPVVWSTFEHHIGFLMRLVEMARDARTSSQQTAAMFHAKETILGNICREATQTAQMLLQEIEQLKRLALPVDDKRSLSQRLERMATDCRALNVLAEEGKTAMAALSDTIVADDRKAFLDMIVDRVMDGAAADAAAAGVHLKRSLPDGETLVSCDSDAIELALSHLVRNAIAYSERGGTVGVSAKLFPDGLLAIEVTDQGMGMHPEFLARCIAPLQSRIDGAGSGVRIGIGLLLSKAIAEAHNGTLELRSMPEEGTTALLVLPPERVNSHAEIAA